jgi:hypothetical protein
MKKIIFLIAAIAALSSCTITKRHYAPGYHVEWKSLGNKIENRNLEDQASNHDEYYQISNENFVCDLETDVEFVQQSPYVIGEGLNTFDSSQEPEESGSVELFISCNQTITRDTIIDDVKPSDYDSKIIHINSEKNKLALIGFYLSLLGLWLPLTVLPGFICSLIAYNQIKKGKGEGRKEAVEGMLISGIYMFVVAFIVLWVLFVSGVPN